MNWILWSPEDDNALIIIPEEAEDLIPVLRSSDPPKTYLLTYAAPVTKRMLHFNNLKYYSIPTLPEHTEPSAWLILELGLFSGRLYFDYSEYETILNHLEHKDEVEEGEIENEGRARSIQFLNFLQEWLAAMRKGQDFSHTPMGFICEGRPLRADHPFFMKSTAEESSDNSDSEFQQTCRPFWSGKLGRNDGEESDEESVDLDEDQDMKFEHEE